MDRGAWWGIVLGVAKSWTGLKQLSMQHINMLNCVQNIQKKFKCDPICKAAKETQM